MKKIFTTLALALCVGSVALAQNSGAQCQGKPTPDAKLISSWQDGDYKVCRWLVREENSASNNEFSLKYKINISKTISSYDENAKELQGFHDFMDKLSSDSLKQILRVNITGYASPDGPDEVNERLANARAMDVRKYINNKYNMAMYRGSVDGVALTWDQAVGATQQSNVPMKAQVVSLMESNHTQMAIEEKLREMPSAWSYLIKNVLPPMRCVEMHVVYYAWNVVETRTPMQTAMAAPLMEEVIVNNYYIIEAEPDTDLLMVEDSFAPIDFPNDRCSCSKRLPHHRDILKEKLRFHKHHAKAKMKDRW